MIKTIAFWRSRIFLLIKHANREKGQKIWAGTSPLFQEMPKIKHSFIQGPLPYICFFYSQFLSFLAKGVVRQSLSKHAEKRAEAVTEMEDGFDGLVVGEEVRKVKDLGIDRKRKAKQGGNQGGLGEMLKAGLNTLNTIQTMSKVFEGSSDGAGGGKNVVVDLVGSLLTNQGAKGKKPMRGKNALDPLVDSAFDLLGGEDATGGLRRYAKPFLKTMFS